MPRLRQLVLVARDLEAVAGELREALGLDEPYRDPGVALFGLRNAVFTIGDCFLEVVSPAREGTAAGRYLARRGADAGYMAIFQVEDFAAARARVAALGVRVAWQVELEDISAMHLNPRDVPGAIVSLDAATPPESWRWAGPDWRRGPGGIVSLQVDALDPASARRRWAEVLGAPPAEAGVTFGAAAEPAAEGIAEIGLALPAREARFSTAGVRFAVVPA